MRRRFYNAVSDTPKCMIIEALEDGLTVSLEGSMWASFIEYSTDYITWNELQIEQYTTEINKGEQILFRGKYSYTAVDYIKFVISKNCELKGSCMYLLGDSIAIKNNSLANYDGAFTQLFGNCTTIKSVSSGFLPATILASNCYSYMFQGCTSLTQVPSLPATTLASNCYNSMFEGCTSLTIAPTLPVTTLATNCYNSMFKGCTSLTQAPSLPATTLADYCYYAMFNGCTNLTTAPTLPATTLRNSCYDSMFYGCTSLTTAPALPATTLASSCYKSMFSDCTSLTTVPTTLPAMTLASYCYQDMFYRCTSLTTAPELPATTLATQCYYRMFQNCSKLNYIKMLATDISASGCLGAWVYGVASSGTFVKNPEATWDVVGHSGVPSGWTVKFDGEEDEGTYDEYFGQIPPESKTFGFPLYITVPFKSEDDYALYYVKNNDSIVKQLWDYCWENSEIVSDSFNVAHKFNNIGDVFINGIKVTLDGESHNGVSNFYIFVSGENLEGTIECGISHDGELIDIMVIK